MLIYSFDFVVSRVMLTSKDELGNVFPHILEKFEKKNGVISWDAW